ncbi:MAG: FtsX-like permease family protein [Bacteroidaceae bacterium]|nr:FtsX-like permease family protein [Bacteroidaceae bacterium]
MITHNLKIAWRNLMKYKMQNLVSVVALAVGMVTIAATHYVLGQMKLPGYCYESYGDRIHVMELEPLKDSTEQKDKNVMSVQLLRRHLLSALTDNGGIPSAEQLHVFDGWNPEYGQCRFYLPDSTYRFTAKHIFFMSPERMHFCGYRSAITGERIPVLKPREVVLSETEARRIYGNHNPIGAEIKCRMSYPPHDELTFTVRDVYKTSSFDDLEDKQLYVVYDEYMKGDAKNMSHTRVHVVLREGCTPEQLIEEANARLKPFQKEVSVYHIDFLMAALYHDKMPTRKVVTLISLFVLLSALVGFLKMQSQLFWMRRREVSLRNVHGASFRSLFALFATEAVISVLAATAIGLCLAAWLTQAAEHYRLMYLEKYNLHEINLYPVIGFTALGIAVLSLIVVGIVLVRMRAERRSLASGLHRNAGHAMRNTMLGLQLTVCMVFIGCLVCMTQTVGKIRNILNVPQDETRYKNSLVVKPVMFEQDEIKVMCERINEIEGIKLKIRYNEIGCSLADEPDTRMVNGFEIYKKSYVTHILQDTTYLEFWNRPIKWLLPPEERENSVLLEDSTYKEIMDKGYIANGTIHLSYYPIQAVGGTYSILPYKKHYNRTEILMKYDFRPGEYFFPNYIVEPEAGKYQQVKDDLEAMMNGINSTHIEPTVMNLRDYMAKDLIIFEVMERLAWILSAVCLIICLMGIWSSIALDTRSRQKEVAIRKVHGAKRKDIALLFGRLYLWLMGVAAVIAAPLLILFNKTLSGWSEMVSYNLPETGVRLPFILSVAITALVTLVIISVRIRKVMMVNPAEIIAKE